MGTGRAETTKAIPVYNPQGRGAQMTKAATSQTEADPVKPSERRPVPGTSTETANRSQKVVAGNRPDVPDAGKPTKAPWTAHAEIEGGVSPDVLYGIAAREKRIHDAETLNHLATMRASGATEEHMMQWAQINDSDSETARLVAEEHFPRMREKVRKLQQDVDDARSLKVDPYHWHKSIGRGGRVAASFAALTGGFAAGKNNPNSAVKMMETAIEQDIAAQEQNIKNTFEGLKLQKGLQADERALFDEQLNAMNSIRATKYAGIVGRIQAAQQHAVTEAHYLALQTAKDHFEVKLLQSIAAAQKEVLRLELDGPLRNAAQLAAYKQQIAQFTEQLQAPAAGGITVPTEQVSTLTGDTVGERPEAEIKMAPAPSRAAAVASRGTRRPSGPSRPSPSRETAAQEPATPQPIEDAAQGISRLETQDEADARVARSQAAKHDAAQRQDVAGNAARIAISDPDIQAPKHVAKNESFARTIAKDANESVVGMTTWSQAIEDIDSHREIRNGGLTGTRDAEVVAAILAKNPPNPAMYKGGESSAAYKMAKARHDYTSRFPEVLERPSSMNGERATITAGGKTYRVKAGARDKETYGAVRDEVIKKERATGALASMAKLVREVGLTGLITSDGKWQIPGLTSDDPRIMEQMNQAVTQAMTYIKTHDPTARISDKDLEVGFDAAVPYMGKGSKFVDFLQSVVGDDTKRRQVERFLGKLAIEAQRIFWQQSENDVVPDFNTLQAMEEEAALMDDFIYTAGQ